MTWIGSAVDFTACVFTDLLIISAMFGIGNCKFLVFKGELYPEN
jgi:hypothetical protein